MAPPEVPGNALEPLLVLLFGERLVDAASALFVAEEVALVLGGEIGVDDDERPRLLFRYDVAPGTLPAEAGGVARP